jgi:hypothetical protein
MGLGKSSGEFVQRHRISEEYACLENFRFRLRGFVVYEIPRPPC